MKLKALLMLLLPGAATLASQLAVTFHAREKSTLYDFISAQPALDYGCRPVVLREDGDATSHKLHAMLGSPEQLADVRRSLPRGVSVRTLDALNKRQEATAPIGKGDRFESGEKVPRGLGTREESEYGVVREGGVLNVDEVASALRGLEKEYGMRVFKAPKATYENATTYGGVVGAEEDCEEPHIYFTSGIHARERGGPDNLIYFVADLLYANEHGKGLKYGSKEYSNEDVKTALGAGIVFIPLLNPDGVRHDQANSNLWRKNRNPASAIAGNAASVGVDLNRNFDFLWDYEKHFNSTVSPASADPTSQAFYGTAPFSEPETQNMAWVYDEFPAVQWYIDVHSAAGTLLYSWGDDEDQSDNPAQNLFNATYDGVRGVVDTDVYGEFIDQEDWDNIRLQANRTTAAMMAVGGRDYVPQQAVGLYPTSGSSDDWSFSRWHKNKSVNKVYGYTMEFGYATNFYPTAEEYVQNIVDTNAGFMEFILTAAEIGLKE